MPPPANKNNQPNLVDTPPAQATRRGFLSLELLIVIVIWLGLMGLVLANRQSISDWWRLRDYQAPTSVATLASQDTMNSYTRHLFYLNRPQLLATVTSFRQYCPENKDTIVLGCYHPDQAGIFIYNVPDPALAGITQVTAAHEVLHAVYARLSPPDRAALDIQLEAFYMHGLTDPRVLAEVKLYQQTEPADVMDEMSCTFGTEVAKLPAPLEAYYKRFFTNRVAIVGYEQQYQGEFTSREDVITNDDQQLATTKQQIDNQQTALSTQLAQLNSDQAHLNSLLAAGQNDSYNAAVPGYNSEVDAYNQGVNSLQAAIASYNQQVAARNLIASQLTTLDSAIDTRLTTQTTR